MYKTQQKEAILEYIMSLDGEHFTVNSIVEHFCRNIGVSTVYRFVNKLVEEGLVCKYHIDKASACFQYTGGRAGLVFHMKCENCGKILHFQCDDVDKLYAHLLSEHGFKVNNYKSVFYGCCNECKSMEK